MSNDTKIPESSTHGAADPWWAVTSVLGDIATRITRRRAAEHTAETPETRRGAGSDPVPRGERAGR
jgi:hypothetical protein